MAPDTFASLAKIGGQYVNSGFVVMEARDLGYVEGIALDIYGYVSEGSGENLFLVHKGVIYTRPQRVHPGRHHARLRHHLARDLGYEVREAMIPREMLYTPTNSSFTGTAAEITPIRSVDKQPIGAGRRGPITQRLQEEFFGITSGRLPDRHGWLTYVHA